MKHVALILASLLLTSCATTTQVGPVSRTELINVQTAGGFYLSGGITGNTATAVNWLGSGLAGLGRSILAKVGLIPAAAPAAAPASSVPAAAPAVGSTTTSAAPAAPAVGSTGALP